MEEWKEYKLGKIAEFRTGKLNSNAAVKNGKYPFFTCAPETYYINDYAFDQKAILLAGNNAEGNFNIKYYEGKFNAYQRTYVINPISKDVNIHYLFYALQLCLQQFKTLSQGTSTKFLTTKILNDFCISVPSSKSQETIVKIIKSLDDKIEVNRRINENLEQQAQALFKSWFVDFEPFKDGEFVESELGMIPKGWQVTTLTSIANYLNGLAMQKFRPVGEDKGIPVLKIKELGQGTCDSSSDRCSSQIDEQYKVNDGDIIFSWSGTLLVDSWCGGVCGLNQHLFKVTSKEFPKWFYYMWTKEHLNNFIHIAKDKAVTMGHIKRGHLEEAKVLVPPQDVFGDMTKTMQPIIEEIIGKKIENRKLAQLRDTLLPRLMSGELNVNETTA